jgi:hypothetical protein
MSDRKGNAGTIMVVMIMGFLLTISTAYMKMIQTEIEIHGMIDHSDRALDAAFSGVQYVMGVAQSKKEMFLDSVADIQERIYFIDSGTPAYLSHVGWGVDAANIRPSDWFFYDNQSDLSLMEDYNVVNKPYMFRVCSIASYSGALVSDEYMIKSQGVYIEYDSSNTNEINRFKKQIIAVVKIATSSKILKLKKWRQMEFETVDADFFSLTDY